MPDEPAQTAGEQDAADRLGPARGLVYGLAICMTGWSLLGLLTWALH